MKGNQLISKPSMTKYHICFFFMMLLSNNIYSQSDTNRLSLRDRIYVGGNLGLQFGTYTLIDVSPLIGYKINTDLSAGAGIIYRYIAGPNYSTSLYGARTFGKYNVWEQLFAYGEYELLYGNFYSNSLESVENLFVGAGYSSNLMPRVSLNAMILYNIPLSGFPIYQNPVIRGGINIGL